MIKYRMPLLFFFGIILLLVVFSFSQVDLNLTLSTNKVYLHWQQLLTRLGYFNRLLSTLIWSTLFIFLFGFYFWILKRAHQKEIDLPVLKMVIGISLMLLLAYPAFSYDIFNYIFDARIVAHYQLSPYHFKPLDFPFDPWTRFMRWTHRYYPYGPLWLWLTTPLAFLGMGKFVVTLGLFKLLFGLFHLFNCLLIYKIAIKLKRSAIFAVLFYALNPLVLVESLLSPHNEVMLLTFTLLGIYLIFGKKITLGVMSIVIGAAIKYLNIHILPLLVFWNKKLDSRFIETVIWWWLIFLIPLILVREFYSWYLLPLMGLLSLIPQHKWISTFGVALALGLLVRYLPYFYFGVYEKSTFFWQNGLWIAVFFMGIIWHKLLWLKKIES